MSEFIRNGDLWIERGMWLGQLIKRLGQLITRLGQSLRHRLDRERGVAAGETPASRTRAGAETAERLPRAAGPSRS